MTFRPVDHERTVSVNLNTDGPSRTYSPFVVYAAMPDVFSPYWCVQIEPLSHERRWRFNLFAYPIIEPRGETGDHSP